MIKHLFFYGLGIILVFLFSFYLGVTNSVTAMTQEEIYYYFGLKYDGQYQLYEDAEGVLYDSMEECLESGAPSCVFTLRDTFETEEIMNQRFNEMMNRHHAGE